MPEAVLSWLAVCPSAENYKLLQPLQSCMLRSIGRLLLDAGTTAAAAQAVQRFKGPTLLLYTAATTKHIEGFEILVRNVSRLGMSVTA